MSFMPSPPALRRLPLLLRLCLVGWLLLLAPAQAAELVVFYGEGCPHCAEQHEFLHELEQRWPQLQVQRYEVWRETTHHWHFREMAQAHGIEAGSVPTLFLDGQVWVGHSPAIAADVERAVRELLADADPSGTDEGQATTTRFLIPVPGLGEVDLSQQSLLLGTALIALVDGFNPCSFWVLTLLLGLVIHSGSRRRVALVGSVFLLTTTAVYGGFMLGVFSVLSYVLYLSWVQWLVAGMALLFGLVNVKDYFWYQRGLSFTISEKHKPGIYRSLRQVMASSQGSVIALVSATVAMALGIALVELPCTAGFPVLWAALLADQNVSTAGFAGLLSLYLLIYLLDEAVVFVMAVATLRLGRFEERHGRLLKLVGGLVMLSLALALFVWSKLL